MQRFFSQSILPVIISGLLTFFAVSEINFILAWICFVPAFISVIDKSSRQAFKWGLVFGSVIAIPGFYWMIPGAEKFTGYNIMYGIGVFIISAVFFSLFFGALFFALRALKLPGLNRRTLILNSITAAAVFCAGEYLLTFVSAGFPWFDFHAGNALAGNLYAIQPAAYFGVYGLTFIVVLVNYIIAELLARRKWKQLTVPVGVVLLYLTTGYVILQNFQKAVPDSREVKVAILAENIPPDIKWDENNGNMLVARLLNLNRDAVLLKPDIALWSESAIPWTYTKNDDLVNEVLRITAPAHITHMMGINTEYKGNVVFNSAYCILPDGIVTGRYDKQYLLSLIEQPLSGALIPFFSSKGFSVKNDMTHDLPVRTPFGKAGIMICNESTLPAAAANMARNGAQYLLNMSNDGWFSDTYIVNLHFYNARLRAVETRKDVAVNCNNGISGLIKASGEIGDEERSEDPFVRVAAVHPNDYLSFASVYRSFFIYFCLFYLLVLIVVHLAKNREDGR